MLIDALAMPELNWQLLATRMCAHNTGVGSDGLLVLLPSNKADFRFRMFNPDGSEDVCGNGLRSASVYLCQTGLCSKNDLLFESQNGIRHAEILDIASAAPKVRINMGKPSLKAADIPADLGVDSIYDYPLDAGGDTYKVTCISIGSPHAIIFADLKSFWDVIPPVSALIERHPAFPERISVNWCHVASREDLVIRTWERAVGPTLGCGTGACAVQVAANLNGFTGQCAKVTSPGGTLEIDWPQRDDLYMTGPANMVFEGEWPLSGDERI